MQLDVFFSYACRDSYLVFAWLKQVEQAGVAFDVSWRPFAIQMGDDPGYWRTPGRTPIRNGGVLWRPARPRLKVSLFFSGSMRF